MSGAIAGYVSTVKIGSALIALVQSADLQMAAKALDTTSLGGNGWDTFIMGTLGGKLALKGSLDQTDAAGQQTIITAFFARTTVANVIFSPDGTKTYTIALCYVTDYHPATPATGKNDFDFTLLVTGAVVAA
jgi:predicted secreted protein